MWLQRLLPFAASPPRMRRSSWQRSPIWGASLSGACAAQWGAQSPRCLPTMWAAAAPLGRRAIRARHCAWTRRTMWPRRSPPRARRTSTIWMSPLQPTPSWRRSHLRLPARRRKTRCGRLLRAASSYLLSTDVVGTAQPLGDQLGDTAAAGDPISSSAPTAIATSTPATAPTTLVGDTAQSGEAPPQQGETSTPEGPPTPGATRSRANKIAPERVHEEPVLPTATGAEQTVRQLADQLGGSSRPSKPGVPRKQPPACFSKAPTQPPARKQPPPLQRRILLPFPSASRPPPPPDIAPCALPGDEQAACGPKHSAGPWGGHPETEPVQPPAQGEQQSPVDEGGQLEPLAISNPPPPPPAADVVQGRPPRIGSE